MTQEEYFAELHKTLMCGIETAKPSADLIRDQRRFDAAKEFMAAYIYRRPAGIDSATMARWAAVDADALLAELEKPQ